MEKKQLFELASVLVVLAFAVNSLPFSNEFEHNFISGDNPPKKIVFPGKISGERTCVDSDGLDMNVQGSVQIYYGGVPSAEDIVYDSCDGDTLFEGYCDGVYFAFDEIPCRFCEEGICMTNPNFYCESDEDCNDDLFCSGVETCVNSRCVDGIRPCSYPSKCNEATDICY